MVALLTIPNRKRAANSGVKPRLHLGTLLSMTTESNAKKKKKKKSPKNKTKTKQQQQQQQQSACKNDQCPHSVLFEWHLVNT